MNTTEADCQQSSLNGFTRLAQGLRLSYRFLHKKKPLGFLSEVQIERKNILFTIGNVLLASDESSCNFSDELFPQKRLTFRKANAMKKKTSCHLENEVLYFGCSPGKEWDWGDGVPGRGELSRWAAFLRVSW